MAKRPLRYHSFILTLWLETEAAPDGQAVWRFRLEDPHTGQRFGFTDLAILKEFLEQITAASIGPEIVE